MQINLSSKVSLVSLAFGLCVMSLTVQAFQNIDRDTYFPGIAQGHKSSNENCPYAQLELNGSIQINETQGNRLHFCSSNKGAGLPNDSCDDGAGGYQACEITGYNVPSLALGTFQIEPINRNKVCNSGSKEYKAKKYNHVEIRNTCQARLSNPNKVIYIVNLDIEDDAKLTLTSGDYWVQQISTSDDAHINISGDVRLFVYYDFVLNNNTKITLEPGASFTVVGYNDIQLNNNSSLEGDVYANHLLSLNNNSSILGRVTSKKLFMEGSSQINNATIPPDPTPHPVLSLRLDEDYWNGTYGEVIDSSGNGFNGTTKNSPQPKKDNPALPVDFNKLGTCGYGDFNHNQAQYIEVPHNSKLSNEDTITVSAWINPSSYPRNDLYTIVSKNGNYEFHLNARGQVNWYWELKDTNYTMNLTTTQSIPKNQWSHVAIRYNAHSRDKASIFINGQEVKSIVENVSPLKHLKENTQPVQIGNDYDLSRTFDGLIDEVNVFDQALSNQQIVQLYEQRHPCPDNVLPTCYEDNFNNGNLNTNWITSASSGNFIPRIINGHLQLTQAVRAQSTASSYQYLYPALGNKIEVEFDYMAYGGNGADGLAIVFSDANITPQAGAFGGPLGYGFKNNSEAVKPGFTGGWLGIGLDEYGNYSKEGGSINHNSNSTSQSVVLRGSGQNYSGYNYISGNRVSPDIDNNNGNSQTHRYRITIDSRNNNTANVTVERSVQWKGDSPRFSTIIGPINVLSNQYNQAAIPENFIMSLTGSTGQLYNTHEIDNFKVCALYSKPMGQQIDHFEFNHPGQGSTCDVSDVTLRACADASCSTLFTDEVDVTLNTSNLGGDGYWLNGNNITMRNGVANLSIGKQTQGNVTLGVVSSEPSTKPFSQTLCSINGQSLSENNCSLSFKPEGLTVIVPDKQANKPVIATIKGCGSSFYGAKNLQVWSDYINPTAAHIIGSPKVSVVSNNAWKTISTTESSATAVTLNFINNEARLPLNYSDAGQLQLNVKHTLPQQQTIKGSDAFVSFPVGLSAYVSNANNSTANSTCLSENITCRVFAHAAEEFNLNVTARAWESDTDTNISNNLSTPNYAQSMLLLDHTLIAPSALSGGNLGNLLTNVYDHVASNGSINRIKESISEVGVFDITVTPPEGYLGSNAFTIKPASTGSIGRFTPAYFSLFAEQPSITDTCKTYTYMGQTFMFDDLPTLELTPLSQTGGQLQNYSIDTWWRYHNNWALRTYVAAPSGIEVIDSDSPSILGIQAGMAKPGKIVKLYKQNKMQLQEAELRYNKPFAPHSPTLDSITLALTAEDLKDSDDICYKLNAAGNCLDYTFPPTSSHRQEWGRITMEDSYGSDLTPLESRIRTESYVGGRFEQNTDTCTMLDLSNFTFDVGTNPAALPVGKGTTSASLSDTDVTNGATSMTFSAPGNGNQGQIIPTLSLLTLPWLQQDADQNDSFESTIKALIHFGIYRGSDRIIWSREQLN